MRSANTSYGQAAPALTMLSHVVPSFAERVTCQGRPPSSACDSLSQCISGVYKRSNFFAAANKTCRSLSMKRFISILSTSLLVTFSACSKEAAPAKSEDTTPDHTAVSNQPVVPTSAGQPDIALEQPKAPKTGTTANLGAAANKPMPDIARMDDDDTHEPVASPTNSKPVAPSQPKAAAATPDIAVVPCQGARLLSASANQCADNEISARSPSGVTMCFKDAALACQCQCGKPTCLISETAPSNTTCN